MRSLSQPRWALYWLVVSSLICLVLWCFMPPSTAVAKAADPMKFLLVKRNLIYLAAVSVIVGKAYRNRGKSGP